MFEDYLERRVLYISKRNSYNENLKILKVHDYYRNKLDKKRSPTRVIILKEGNK